MKKMKYVKWLVSVALTSILLIGCVPEEATDQTTIESEEAAEEVVEEVVEEKSKDEAEPEAEEKNIEEEATEPLTESSLGFTVSADTLAYNGRDYAIKVVDGGDRSGSRLANVAVDIGFGDRVYWALTNEHGQLVHVLAEEIILQNDDTEPVNDSGRYYGDEANVPGTERSDLDQGHVIADSLGGVANAYNITPQESTLNRHGDQAYMEDAIRDAGGCTAFVATITYPDTETQIPSKYRFEHVLRGNKIVDEFENKNPEGEAVTSVEPEIKEPEPAPSATEEGDVSKVDTNGNGQVTIAEAKAAGYTMPIRSDHWLYKYMRDNDGDGMVGE